MSLPKTNDASTIASYLLSIPSMDNSHAHQAANQILFCQTNDIQKLSFTIENNQGTVAMIRISATNYSWSSKIDISWKVLEAKTNIPTLTESYSYDVENGRKRVFGMRYGPMQYRKVSGTRVRAMNGGEIDLVNKVLMNALQGHQQYNALQM